MNLHCPESSQLRKGGYKLWESRDSVTLLQMTPCATGVRIKWRTSRQKSSLTLASGRILQPEECQVSHPAHQLKWIGLEDLARVQLVLTSLSCLLRLLEMAVLILNSILVGSKPQSVQWTQSQPCRHSLLTWGPDLLGPKLLHVGFYFPVIHALCLWCL